MLTTEKLNQYIDNPSLMSSETIDDLWRYIRKYPYFSAPRVLLAKLLKQESHRAFPLAFRLASAYIGDRSLLKMYLESSFDFREKEPVIIEKEDFEESENKTEVQLIEKEIDAKQEEEKIETFDEEDFSKETENLTEADKDNIDIINVLKERLSKIQISDNEKIKEEEIPDEKQETESAKEALINKFIEAQPTITPQKPDFFRPVDIAKRSSIPTDDIISEALANIYASQGHLDKAIEMYNKLIDVFPEKSITFANRIKELKEKL